MKRFFGYLLLVGAMLSFAACQTEEPEGEKLPVIVYDGPVDLKDAGFGMYYGDKNFNMVGVYSLVLSDAVCSRDGYGRLFCTIFSVFFSAYWIVSAEPFKLFRSLLQPFTIKSRVVIIRSFLRNYLEISLNPEESAKSFQ